MKGLELARWPKIPFQNYSLARSFKLVDAETVRHNLGHDKIMGLLAGDKRVAAAVGSRCGAELLLLGNAEADISQLTFGEIKINSNQVCSVHDSR